MPTDLITQMQNRGWTRRSEAAREYLELCRRAHNPKEGDGERLERCLQILGRTLEQFARHVSELTVRTSAAQVHEELAKLISAETQASRALTRAESEQKAAIDAATKMYEDATAAYVRSAGETQACKVRLAAALEDERRAAALLAELGEE
jgi:phosphomannomutase